MVLKREVKLIVAIAAQRMEDVAGEALRVDADDGRCRVQIAHDEGHGGFRTGEGGGQIGVAGLRIVDDALKAQDAEVSPAGGKVGIGELAYGEEGHGVIIGAGF